MPAQQIAAYATAMGGEAIASPVGTGVAIGRPVSYVPFLGAVLEGEHSGSNFDIADPDIYYAPQTLAELKVSRGVSDWQVLQASKRDPDTGYFRKSYSAAAAATPEIYMEFTDALKKEAYLAALDRKARKAYVASRGQVPLRTYTASVPPGGNTPAAQVVGPLTQIPFIRNILGMTFNAYYTQLLFKNIPLPNLHAEIPEEDYTVANAQMEETQYVDLTRPNFDHHFFLAKRNESAFLIPREYRMRATLDPYARYVEKAGLALRRMREALAFLALSKLPKGADSFAEITDSEFPDPQADITSGFPAAANNAPLAYEEAFADFWAKTLGVINSIVMHPKDFYGYETNFFAQGFKPYPKVSEWGLVQFPGSTVERRVAISPYCPKGIVYCFNNEFAFLGEGPMVSESWAKPEANSDAAAYRDYMQMIIQNPKRAGFKCTIDGSADNFDGEITTLAKARELVTPPRDLLQNPH